jgi:hypothetical protein
MGRAQSPHIWRCGSQRRHPHAISFFGGSVGLWRSGRGCAELTTLRSWVDQFVALLLKQCFEVRRDWRRRGAIVCLTNTHRAKMSDIRRRNRDGGNQGVSHCQCPTRLRGFGAGDWPRRAPTIAQGARSVSVVSTRLVLASLRGRSLLNSSTELPCFSLAGRELCGR